MKKLLLVLMTCALALGLFAQNDVRNNAQNSFSERQMHVTAAQALEVGYTFMNTGGHERGNGNVSKQTMQLVYTGTATDSLTRAVTDCYYVFSLQPKGFVIVAADERVEPILGYSYDNNFVVEGMPENVRGWMNHYEQQIKAAVDRGDLPSTEIAEKWTLLRSGQAMPTRSVTAVSPLIQTTWDQDLYYNQMCPADANGPDGHAYVGCVATAMAQIIRYWQWPNQGFNSHSYVHYNYGTLSVDYNAATYNYSNMPNILSSSSLSSQVNEVAKLMYHCGVAVDMDYSCSGSGADMSSVPNALCNYFAYINSVSYVERSHYTDNDWTNLIRQELNNARPVLYAGRGVGSHAFVCDGYDYNGAFHFNWGWNGSFNDAYYMLDALTPCNHDYSYSQEAIIGISATGSFISISDNTVSFYASVGSESEVKLLSVRGHSLSSNISVTAGNGFVVSTNGNNFYNSVSLPASGGNLYVKYLPTSTNNMTQSMTLSSGSNSVSVMLYGTPFLTGQPCPGNETVSDYDGNVYNTVQIGNQCWMKENLRVTHFENGVEIPMGPGESYEMAFRFSPNNSTSNTLAYGYLYNWAAVMRKMTSSNNNRGNVQGICPSGWHIPSKTEWTNLTEYVRGLPVYWCNGNNDNYAKALASNTFWNNSDVTCAVGNNQSNNNVTGFSVVPAGYSLYGRYVSDFGACARYWTSTEYSDHFAWYVNFNHESTGVTYENGNGSSFMKVSGFSVRCILGAGNDLSTVNTNEASAITFSTATCGGNVTSDGGATVTARGVCWSTSPNPTINNNHTNDGSGTGSFTSNITGLMSNTMYYVRAYAINSIGVAYGETRTFTTEGELSNCLITFELHDSYGDGWNGNKILVLNHDTIQEVTLDSGADGLVTVTVYEGALELEWVNGSWIQECSFKITGPCLYYTSASAFPSAGLFYTTTLDCESSSPPIPAFTYSTENTCDGVMVSFVNESQNANYAYWDFGDGGRSGEYSPTHTYNASGNYLVQLNAYNMDCDNPSLQTINVEIEIRVQNPQVQVQNATICKCEMFDQSSLGELVTLADTAGLGVVDVRLEWATSAAGPWSEITPVPFTNVGIHHYYVRQTNIYQTAECTGATAELTITIKDIPVPQIIGGPYDFCNNSDDLTQTLIADRGDDDCSTTSVWFLNDVMVYTGDIYTVNLADIRPATNVDQTVKFTVKAFNDESNCYSNGFSSVTIKFHQTPNILLTYPETICPESESVDFIMSVTASPMSTPPYIVYQTSDFDSDRTNVLNSQYSWLSSSYSRPYTKITDFECGNFYHLYYTVTDANGCVARDTATFMAFDSEEPIVTPDTWITTLYQPDFEGENLPDVIRTFGELMSLADIIDNCGVNYFTYEDIITVSSDFPHENVLIRTYTIYDNCYNTATFTQTFIAHDTTHPSVPEYEVIPNHNCQAPYSGLIRLIEVPRGYTYELFSDMNPWDAIETQNPAFDSDIYTTNVVFDELEGNITYRVKITSPQGYETMFEIFVPEVIEFPAFSVNATSNTFCDDENFNGTLSFIKSGINFIVTNAYGEILYDGLSSVLTGLAPGYYTIQGTDMVTGCQTIETKTINDNPTPIPVIFTVTPNHACVEDLYDGTISVYATGGSGIFEYNFNGGEFGSQNFWPSLAPGIYYIVARDVQSGCETIIDVSVPTENDCVPVLYVNNRPFCLNEENATLTAAAISDCEDDFTYRWQRDCHNLYFEGATVPVATDAEMGCIYSVTATSVATGCISTASVEVMVYNQPPIVTTKSITNITSTSAKSGGNVTDTGCATVTERGVCWSTSPNPTVSGNHTTNGSGTGSFTSSMTGLSPNTTYYVRAYATNSAGTSYGSQKTFTTSCNTVTVSIAGNTSIDYGGSTTLTASGASNYSWSDGGVSASITVSPTSTTTYTVTGTNSYGCMSTASVTVTVNYKKPTVTTKSVTNITTTSAKSGGNVTATGGAAVTARGVCWSTSPNPTVSDSHTTNGSGTGSFTSSMTGLSPNTTYYVRAYAKNSVGTSYGAQKTFTTSCNTVTVSIAGNTTIDYGGSTTLTASGTSSYIWSNGGTNASIMVSPTSTTTYTVTGTNSYGCTGTASVIVTVNSVAPTVKTNSVTNIAKTTANCGGNVISSGSAPVTARGVCWSTNQNPTTNNAHTSDGSGTGVFASSLAGLDPGTTYYVRAYATSDAGTTYGNEVTFTTNNCVDISLPYTENFDSYTTTTTTETGVQPDCWEVVAEDAALTGSTKPQMFYGYATSDSYSLRMKNRCVYAMPALDGDVDVSDVEMRFNLRQPNSVYRLQVGVVNDNGEFEPVKTINNASTDIEEITVNFANYTGNGHRIAFRNTLAKGSNLAYSTNYIDDIVLSLSCGIHSLPFKENFDGQTTSTTAETGAQPECWEVITEDATLTNATKPQVYYNAAFATSGCYTLRMKNRCVYAMPDLDNDIDVSELALRFKLRQPKTAYRLQVGVINDNGEFEVLKTINNTSSDMEEITVDFSCYAGTGHLIAFRNTLAKGSTLDYSINYIDDIVLDYTNYIMCGIEDLPYAENFDSYTVSTTAETGVQPNCWDVVAEDVALTNATKPQVYYNSSYATSGSYTLRMRNRCIYAMPALSRDLNVNEMEMRFKLRQPKAIYRLQVGVVNDNGEFVPVKTINNASTDIEDITVDFTNYTGKGHRIAFRNTLGGGSTLDYSVNYIDDIVFAKACRINELPYTENFDDYTQTTTAETGVQPDCWEVVTEDVALTAATKPQVYYNSAYATSGSYTLRMRNRCVYAMPALKNEMNLNEIEMRFSLRQPSSVYRLQVGVVNDNGEFVPVKTINNASTGIEEITIDFTNYTGNGRRIAFRNTLAKGSTLDYSVNYIDDIVLAKSCKILELPYAENFDGYSSSTVAETKVQPDCWEVVTEDVALTAATKPQVYFNATYATSGSYTLRMKNRCVYAMPVLGMSNVQELTLNFNLRQPSSVYRLQVGVVNENGEFEVVKTLNNASTAMEPVTVDFSNYTGSGHRIAFRNTLAKGSSLDYSVNYIDDIMLVRATNNKSAEVTDANAVDALAADRDHVDVVVYPNPTKDVVNVQCTMNNAQCSGIEIVDVYGKIITTVGTRFIASAYSPASAQSPVQINVSGLAAGMYFVRVTTDRGVVTKPFVKR